MASAAAGFVASVGGIFSLRSRRAKKPTGPPGKASDERGSHLLDVKVPMLFLQGSRDNLADLGLLRPLVERLGARAMLKLLDQADHSFHVPARSGRKDAEVREEMLAAVAGWIEAVAFG